MQASYFSYLSLKVWLTLVLDVDQMERNHSTSYLPVWKMSLCAMWSHGPVTPAPVRQHWCRLQREQFPRDAVGFIAIAQ